MAELVRDYGPTERAAAPADSRQFHQAIPSGEDTGCTT
jgi:hypothetical protein